jgi:hypothetical protein
MGGFRLPKRLLLLAPILMAQAASATEVVDSATVAPPAATATDCGCLTLPALTPIRIEILAPLGSKTSKSGDIFPIRLAEPLAIDGRELVPAGTSGMGEVVHAKKAGGSGAAGELVLAARYLDVDGRHLKLRSLRLIPEGNSKINTVNTIMVATAASPIPVSLVGFFINGGQAGVPEGTIAEAKTAEPFDFPGAKVTTPDSTVPAETGQTGEKIQ